jgi:hypothetical protein
MPTRRLVALDVKVAAVVNLEQASDVAGVPLA